MPLLASNVQLPTDLSGTFANIGGQGLAGINNVYSQLQNRYANDARGFTPGGPGLGPNSYGGQRFAATKGLDIGGLESGLGGILGNTGYQNTLDQRDYNQKLQLAQQAAALNRPGLLQQIFQGIGSVGPTAAMAYGAFGGGGGSSYTPPNVGNYWSPDTGDTYV